jgi:hypothetical protein
MWDKLLGFLMLGSLPVAIKLLKGLGFGVVTYVGLNWVLDYVETHVFQSMESLPTKAFQLSVLIGLDQYFVIVLSALAIAFALRSFGAGEVKRIVMGGAP